MADAWKEVSVEMINNCFAKCGITEKTSEDEDEIVDEEFNALFNELADSECDMQRKIMSVSVSKHAGLCPQSTPI